MNKYEIKDFLTVDFKSNLIQRIAVNNNTLKQWVTFRKREGFISFWRLMRQPRYASFLTFSKININSKLLIINKIIANVHKNITPWIGNVNSPNNSHNINTIPPHILMQIAPINPNPICTYFSFRNASISNAKVIPINTPPKILG